MRTYLAWTSILDEKELLDLSPHQVRQAETQKKQPRYGDGAAAEDVPVAAGADANEPAGCGDVAGHPPVRPGGARRAGQQEATQRRAARYEPGGLRMEMDRMPLWRGDHVAIKQLVDDFGRYLYLPRLKEAAVLLGAIRDGCALLTWEQDAFAYAESYDEAAQRYRGLRYGQHITVTGGDADSWCALRSRADRSR